MTANEAYINSSINEAVLIVPTSITCPPAGIGMVSWRWGVELKNKVILCCNETMAENRGCYLCTVVS